MLKLMVSALMPLILAAGLPASDATPRAPDASAAPVAGHAKLRLGGGQRRDFVIREGASTVMFRGLNAVRESTLLIYFRGQRVPLSGDGAQTFGAIPPGSVFTLSNDGNWLEFSVEIVWQ